MLRPLRISLSFLFASAALQPAAVTAQGLAAVDPAALPPEIQSVIVFPPDKTSFMSYGEGGYLLTYESSTYNRGRKMRSGGTARSSKFVTVTKLAKPAEALKYCEDSLQSAAGSPGRTVSRLPGFDCGYVVAVDPPGDRSKWEYEEGGITRQYSFAIGPYLASWQDSAQPVSMMVASSSYGLLVAALKGEQPLGATEAAFRKVLLSGLGLGSLEAKMCLDEVMNEVEAQAPKEARLAEDIAALRKAAARAHAIEVLAQVPVGPGYFDEFDPKWWEALREVIPDPTAPANPQDTALDRLIDLLPPPLGTIVKFTREADKQMRSIKRHLVDPTLHREIYECYKAQRDADQASMIQAGMGQDALEGAAAHTLLNATADMSGRRCLGAETFKSSYERELSRARTKEEREQEFARLVRPVAMRFEFIYQVERAHARKAEMLKEAWMPVSTVLERLRGRVNACLSRPR